MKTILVTGSTGKQGSSFIRAALSSTSNSAEEVQLLALTRDPTSESAKSLLSSESGEGGVTVKLVKGDLDNPESIEHIFKESEPIWGVFAVLAFPGLGKPADGEEKQGKNLIDIAERSNASFFVLSTTERGGETGDAGFRKGGDRSIKIELEHYLRSKTSLPSAIVRPGVFMDLFSQDLIGKIAVAHFTCGLKDDTQIDLVASEDIGKVTYSIFEQWESYKGMAVTIIGDALSMSEVKAAYKRGTGSTMSEAPHFLARLILYFNAFTKEICEEIEGVHQRRVANEMDETRAQAIERCNTLNPGMLSFEQWVRERETKQSQGGPGKAGWNKVSILGLLTGKS